VKDNSGSLLRHNCDKSEQQLRQSHDGGLTMLFYTLIRKTNEGSEKNSSIQVKRKRKEN